MGQCEQLVQKCQISLEPVLRNSADEILNRGEEGSVFLSYERCPEEHRYTRRGIGSCVFSSMTSRPHAWPSVMTGHWVIELAALLILSIVSDESFLIHRQPPFTNKLTLNLILKHHGFTGIFWSVAEHLDSNRSQCQQNHDGDVGTRNIWTARLFLDG